MKTVTLPQPVLYVLYVLQTAGYEAYVVGGAVRDAFLARDTTDWDFTTDATPEQIQVLFPKHFYDNSFGTVGIPAMHLFTMMRNAGWQVDEAYEDDVWGKEVFEVTTYRTEVGYTDKRRPDEVHWGTSIDEDLARRDFTINAMALSVGDPKREGYVVLNGHEALARKQTESTVAARLIDLYEGMTDLDKKIVRTVRDADERFEEDALRMMRAIRFGAQLGFGIEDNTLDGVMRCAHLIEHVSWERKRDELMKILASDYPADGIQLLFTSGLLMYLIPEMLPMRGVRQGGHHIYDVWTHSIESLRHCPSTDPLVRLATLLHDVGKPKTYQEQGPRGVTFYGHEVVGARMVRQIGRRLRLSNKEVDKLTTLVRWHMFMYDPEMTDAAIRRFIRRVGIENINDMMLLRVGDRKGGGSKATSWRLRELQQRIGEQLYQPLAIKDLQVDGADVMEVLGIEPGPAVGAVLKQLFEEVLEDATLNTRAHLLERIRVIGS